MLKGRQITTHLGYSGSASGPLPNLQGPTGKATYLVSERSLVGEYLQLTLYFSCLVLLLSLLTYHPLDPSDFVSSFASSANPNLQGKTENLFGPFGANVSEWAYQILGLMAPAGAVAFLLLVIDNAIRRRAAGRLLFRMGGFLQFAWFGSVILDLVLESVNYRGATLAAGGYLGGSSAAWLEELFGRQGTVLLCAFGVLASLPLLGGVSLFALSAKLARVFPHRGAKELAAALGESENGPSSRGARTVSERLSSASSKRDEKAEISTFQPGLGMRNEALLRPKEVQPRSQEYEIVPRSAPVPAREINASEMLRLLTMHEAEGLEERRAKELLRLEGESRELLAVLANFGVTGTVMRSQPGPVVNVHEFEPAPGVKVGRVIGLQEELALGLKAKSVLMAPQAGKSTIGIEIPAHFREIVSLREVLESEDFQSSQRELPMVLGKSVDGRALVADLASMPHLLIAGATGSGKSVAINVLLLSLLLAKKPEELRLILVDPKMLELSNYDGIGHLLLPVVTEPSKAAGALRWAIREMDRRYALLKNAQVRNIASFNSLDEHSRGGEKLPYIVVVIDELCDLMMTAPKEIEDSVQRLAQKARASGIHLVLATQRPSVDVLTGVIKANLPCRISFQVASRHDSRTIIESIGAEKLLGKGDMLFMPPGTSRVRRAHGAFVSDVEVNAVCDRMRALWPCRYENGVMSEVEQASQALAEGASGNGMGSEVSADMPEEELYERAVDFAMSVGKVSTSSIQRQFRIGYNKAARLMDRMDREGLVGPSDVAGKPREVISRRDGHT